MEVMEAATNTVKCSSSFPSSNKTNEKPPAYAGGELVVLPEAGVFRIDGL